MLSTALKMVTAFVFVTKYKNYSGYSSISDALRYGKINMLLIFLPAKLGI